jgi:phosphoribosyl 1,2-cyclic phosphodiesterase
MKRDMELIRELLIAIEAKDSNTFFAAEELELKTDREKREVYYNLQLMMDANLLEASIVKSMQGIEDVVIKRMTWEGHEFLDNARNESIWKAAKETIAKKGLSIENVGFGVLTQLLASVAKQYFDLH